MHLSLVEIKNFRSFESLRVDLVPGLNVLVGRNNTGKTNILQAIRHALGPSASRGDALWLDRDDFYRASATDPADRVITIELTFTGLSEAQRAFFYEIVDFDLADLSKSRAIIRFEASWPRNKRQASIKRTGGPALADAPDVPATILQSLPITFLPALRDAEAFLTPGYRSRLASLLRDVADRKGEATAQSITDIYIKANQDLEAHSLIKETKGSLQATTKQLAGSDYSASAIKAAEIEFEKILRTLQVQMDDTPIGSLSANGLGYNNLLYMAVVLEHLKSPDPDECPMLLVEEPEAHLHPQLTMLLADYLANNTPGARTPQTIVTTHSPTLAAHVPPSRVNVLFSDEASGRKCQCNCLRNAGMDEKEERDLQRMMDITRATLYFAKAAILVEGISESLLLPVLAKRLGYDLSQLHVSVIPICGVGFGTFKKVLDPTALGIPVAIITDADPPVPTETTWKDAIPESQNGTFKLSDRTKRLLESFEGHQTVGVYSSKLTLEYDLAEAGDVNADQMAEVWEGCFVGVPGTFNKSQLASAGSDRRAKAAAAWRGICRAKHTGSKAEFAHRLAAVLDKDNGTGVCPLGFRVPQYIRDAIEFVVNRVGIANPSPGATSK